MPKLSTRSKSASKSRKPALIKNAEEAIRNGLGEALFGFGYNQGTQLNQTDTIELNLRNYLISNNRNLLSQAYAEHGLFQTVVNVPVDDAMRGGVEIKSKQLDPEQIELLQIKIEEMDILDESVGQAHKWNRLYGGAGILILCGQDVSSPLNIQAINENDPLEFRAIDMWEMFYSKVNINTGMEGSLIPQGADTFEFYDYYGQKIHKSRIMKLKGITAPSFIRPRLRGWGLSVAEVLVNSINQYLKANNVIFEVLDEFKVDYYKIKDMAQSLLSGSGTSKIHQRVQLANMQKNFQHAVTMDADDDFQQKQLSFTGIAETMQGIKTHVAADLRMPLTKIFGISATGFSSGEDDIEVYNAMVESTVRAKAKKEIMQIIKILSQKEFQFIPDDITIQFKPLRILSSEQEENVKTQKFNRLLSAKQGGELTTKEFRDGCNKDNLLSIQLETNDDLLDELNPESQADSVAAMPGAATAPKSSLDSKKPPEAKA